MCLLWERKGTSPVGADGDAAVARAVVAIGSGSGSGTGACAGVAISLRVVPAGALWPVELASIVFLVCVVAGPD